MKILKYIPIIALCGAIAGLTSCELDEELKDTPTPGHIRTESDVSSLITGLYAHLNDNQAFKYQGMLMLTLCADDLYSEAQGTHGIYADRSYGSHSTHPLWNKFYSLIGNTNNLLALMDELELEPAFEKRTRGEAYFLRAFAYYYLVRLYGGVPLRTEPVNIGSDFYQPRNTIEEVYKQVFGDFKAASVCLPLQSAISGSELGRASKGAAQAFLADAYLTFGNQRSLQGEAATEYYRLAGLYADSVIGSGEYRLLNDFADLFDVSKENDAYQEVIFGARFSRDLQRTGLVSNGSELANWFGVPNLSNMTGAPGNSGSGSGSALPMPWIVEFYRSGDYTQGDSLYDYRTEVTYVSRGYNAKQDKFMVTYPNIPAKGEGTIESGVIGKYIDAEGRDKRNHENDFFIIRLAEIYLIKAEVENELNGGPTPEAYDAFNMLRARARKADGTPRPVPANLEPGLSQTEFRMKIFEERGAELIAEGHRWFDLVRMQSPDNPAETMYEYQFLKVLPGLIKKLPAYDAKGKKWKNTGGVYGPALNVTKKHILFPVPSGELTQNPDFGSQNPGW